MSQFALSILVGFVAGVFVGIGCAFGFVRGECWTTGYWRTAYETLVKQTGRDLNDGLGCDPRSPHFKRIIP